MEKEYKKIIKFKYNNSYYQLLLDDNNKYFYLRINNDSTYSYVTIDELIVFNKIFGNSNNILNFQKEPNKIKLVPKVFIKGALTTLTLSTLLSGCAKNSLREIVNNVSFNNMEYRVRDQITFAIEDSNEELIVDTYFENNYFDYTLVNDMEYLNNVLDYKFVSLDQIHNAIDNNDKINNRFKQIIHEFVNDVNKKHPNAELRVLYENLKDIQIVECTKKELEEVAFSNTYGCYSRSENKLYLNKEYEYNKGSWEYQIIYHELSHVLRNRYFQKDDMLIKIQPEGNSFSGFITSEALNSIFTVSLFDYEEKEIAYQLQSNYYKTMIECLDNYTLTDYVNHSISYLAKKLDEHNNDNNYAKCIMELIETQYKDYYTDKIEIKKEEYYPLYEYILDMYFKKYVNENMTYYEVKNMLDILVNKITYNVSDNYNLDINYFYDYLENYCNEKEINKEIRKH